MWQQVPNSDFLIGYQPINKPIYLLSFKGVFEEVKDMKRKEQLMEAVYLLLIAIAMLACTGILAVDLKAIKRILEAIQENLEKERRNQWRQ